MKNYSLAHLSDGTLLRDLAVLVARDRSTTAALLAHLAEVDTRKLYLPAAYPSMFAWCVGELRLSEEAAFKRIHAARAARQFPALFEAVADGRLHLSAVVMLAPRLTRQNAEELVRAASGQTKSGIERLLADRFPQSEILPMVQVVPTAPPPHTPDIPAPAESFPQHAPGRVGSVDRRPAITPAAPERFLLQLTIGRSTRDKLQEVQELLGHQVSPGDVAEVFDRALDALRVKLQKRKFAATDTPRRSSSRAAAGRYVPAAVRRAVWQRDGGRCTFVSASGRPCDERTRLEFDHVVEAARGGPATVANLRLRCRAHNQYEAERTFGVEFMKGKRQARSNRNREHEVAVVAETAAHERATEVIPFLRKLGFRAAEARSAAEHCENLADASLEARVKAALSYLTPRARPMCPARH